MEETSFNLPLTVLSASFQKPHTLLQHRFIHSFIHFIFHMSIQR